MVSGEEVAIEEDPLDNIQNPVLPGDFADPSVVRVGDDYWATATSSEWAPLFPLLHSKDLQNWDLVGHVFPEKRPDWAEAHFWAPEISYEDGKYYIYYTAKKKGGPLCVGVASSTDPKGPYKDHGPLVCQEAGAIDGFPIRDEQGDLYLIWKEDGNSRGEPTPMWGQRMNEERTELLGEKFELFRNDPETWEGNLVEGAFILKKDGYFYAFYSGDACCGRGCTYGIGVARAKELKGPWAKYEKNPIKKENDTWKCAGHGSLVQAANGRYYFLYHAYKRNGTVYTGRQGLLSEIIWTENGWPEFKKLGSVNQTVVSANELPDLNVDFEKQSLSQEWQWPVGDKPEYRVVDGVLMLKSEPDQIGAVAARRTLSPNYRAITAVTEESSPEGSHGLASIGDENNALGVSVSQENIEVWKVEEGKREQISAQKKNVPVVYLKMEVRNGEKYEFFWSEDGENWNSFPNQRELNGYFLPPWDRAVRVGLVSKGPENSRGVFSKFEVENL